MEGRSNSDIGIPSLQDSPIRHASRGTAGLAAAASRGHELQPGKHVTRDVKRCDEKCDENCD